RPGKHPIGTLVPRGVKDATTDPDTILRWWAECPSANVGIATGALSGFIGLDVDPRHRGDESLAALEREHGKLPATVEAGTAGGGRHLLFAHSGVPIRNRVNLARGLDVRADGGYIVAPPSQHASGEAYAWIIAPDAAPLAEIPTGFGSCFRTATREARRLPV